MTRFSGFVGQAEAAALPYRYISFEVPSRCTEIRANYGFEGRSEGACAVDIGLFDIRGTEPLTGGFRGWSGAARREFVVRHDAATPGYLAGPLPSGTWSVVLGFYQVPEAGLDWWLEVVVATGDPTEERHRPTPQHRDRRSRTGWYRGDFHSHTEHSDGSNSIDQMAAFAESRGLEFLAITDHNTTSHHWEIDGREDWPLLLIPGEEVTTYAGHANVWGLRQWIDFRVTSDEEVHRLWRWVDQRTPLFSMNHPKPVGPPWEWVDPGFRIREVWQAPWQWQNWRSVRDWDEALASGKRITAVGGSDAHSAPPAEAVHPHHVGDPTTWVFCEGGLSEWSVLSGVLAGRTAISDGPAGPFVALDLDGETVTAETARAGGSDLVAIADGEERWRVSATGDGQAELPTDIRWDRYLRLELRSAGPFPGGREVTRALSNVVYR